MPGPSATRRRAAGIVLVAVALAGCSGSRPRLGDATTVTPSTTTTAVAPVAKVAQANAEVIDVFPDETADVPARQVTAADATSAPGIPIVLLVKQEGEDRLEVHLPVEPPGSTGWVRRADVTVATVSFRIEVTLGEHRLRVYDGAEVVVDEPVALGTADRPAPGSTYFLKELLQPPDPSGPYGTYAYGLAGFSTDLGSFNTGNGIVGIHGTNDASVLGQDTPTGSIRLADEIIQRLVNDIGLPLGTPVEILE